MRKSITIRIIFLILTCYSCVSKEKSNVLKAWEGKYFYEEEPLKAIAGYNMVMEWKLNIYKEKDKADKYIGNLEINGQQTYMKIQTEITGDEKMISLKYIKTIDGTVDNLKPGDTLFKLSKETKGIITKWIVLEPRLPENPTKECICFKNE